MNSRQHYQAATYHYQQRPWHALSAIYIALAVACGGILAGLFQPPLPSNPQHAVAMNHAVLIGTEPSSFEEFTVFKAAATKAAATIQGRDADALARRAYRTCEHLALQIADHNLSVAKSQECMIRRDEYSSCADFDDLTAAFGAFHVSGEFQGRCRFVPHGAAESLLYITDSMDSDVLPSDSFPFSPSSL